MAQAYESVTVETKDHVAQLTDHLLNSITALGGMVGAQIPERDAGDSVEAQVVTAARPALDAWHRHGLDVPAMGGSFTPLLAGDALAGPRAVFHREVKRMQGAITAVADCRTPTIASVHGWCIGGGVDLISAVDVRYASADAKFSVREVKLAIVADVGSLARLPMILNDGHLRELALTGKDIDAARAEKIGLVNDVYADADASLAAAHATAAEIAANPPLTVHGIKDVLDQQRVAAVSESLRYVAAWNAAFLPSKDLTEGIAATFEKRPPQFTGE
ncbi:enoyl-CoA hydratase [Mycobacterium malmoense]|uniref:crotonase/enoyl-CoA hydratase family protein n=1 Tax=Mycobacterium malmoense TaxID=1780 RepID=UPI00080BBB1D|nr:crotonase/enoyl-CoA hydratase family protein [Mycobacterium malmoense]OCB40200.1 enoyl-CoA hydratase [Mycobacterium malmoense]